MIRKTWLVTWLRELGDLPPDPTALVFDDFHLVDDAPDIRHIAIELLARAPERLSFVFASRRTPPVRIARLRARGEVAELGTADLRFDATETERLFRETYEEALSIAKAADLEESVRPLVEVRLADLERLARESSPPVPPAA